MAKVLAGPFLMIFSSSANTEEQQWSGQSNNQRSILYFRSLSYIASRQNNETHSIALG